MSKNSSTYVFIFATIVTLVAGISLAVTATVLKPRQEKNVAVEKKSFILSAIGEDISSESVIQSSYDEYITELVVNEEGEIVEGENAFEIDPKTEHKMNKSNPSYEMKMPVYKYDGPKGQFYVVPLSGKGLWGPIWGYIALDKSYETVKGVVFDHKSETPGLGAEITTDWFQEQFKGKEIKDEDGEFVGINVLKGQGNELGEHTVDGISGATVTSVGVKAMLEKDLSIYNNYFKKIQKS